MWKANGKTTTLLLFLDNFFHKQRQTRDAFSGDKTIWREVFLEETPHGRSYSEDWKKEFDRVKWTKLTQILKETGTDWREGRLISKLYIEQSVKIRLDQGETRSVKTGRGVRQACCLSPILFNLYSEYLTKEILEGFGDFKIGGQVIRTVKYADDLVLLAREETVLQGMVDRLIEIGRHYGMEMNVENLR
jgi:hypothetical protein